MNNAHGLENLRLEHEAIALYDALAAAALTCSVGKVIGVGVAG